MAIGKWSMYISAVLFLIVGLGALAIAVVPDADEWFAEQILDRSGVSDDTFGQDAAVNAIVDSDGISLTAWILALTFLPTAALFVWIGRWFKSMEGGVSSMFGGSTNVAAANAAYLQQQPGTPVPYTTPMPTEQAPVPKFGDPGLDPPDPTAGGIIS